MLRKDPFSAHIHFILQAGGSAASSEVLQKELQHAKEQVLGVHGDTAAAAADSTAAVLCHDMCVLNHAAQHSSAIRDLPISSGIFIKGGDVCGNDSSEKEHSDPVHMHAMHAMHISAQRPCLGWPTYNNLHNALTTVAHIHGGGAYGVHATTPTCTVDRSSAWGCTLKLHRSWNQPLLSWTKSEPGLR